METTSRILLVDEGESGQALQAFLREDGHCVELTDDGQQACQALSADQLDLVIADLLLPSVDGFGLLATARESRPTLPVILCSEYGTIETAVEALKRGAYHYFQKPLDFAAVRATVVEALRGPQRPPLRKPAAVSGPVSRLSAAELGIVGCGPWVECAMDVLRRVAPTRATVLLTGASGTGKELFARAVHRISGRKGPFVAVSCAALSRDLLESELFGHEKGAFTGADRRRQGRFELADSGTLFLDEVGEVPLDLQVKLLRVLQERQFERVGGTETLNVDVRIVAATNRDLAAAIRERAFREDLYYRLKVVEISLPSLRDRLQDIEPLAAHFVKAYALANDRPVLAVDRGVLQLLQRYAWPGNVREFENVIERAVVLAEPSDTTLTASLLPANVLAAAEALSRKASNTVTLPAPAEEQAQLKAVADALRQTGGSVIKAAKLLGLSPQAVRYQADRAGLWRRCQGARKPSGGALDLGTDIASRS